MCVCVCSSSTFGSVSSFYLRFSNFTSIFWYFAFYTESVLFDVSVVRSTLFFWRLLVRSYSIAIAFSFMCEQSYWCRQLFSLSLSLILFIYSSENPTRMNRIIIYERLLFEFSFIFGHFFRKSFDAELMPLLLLLIHAIFFICATFYEMRFGCVILPWVHIWCL